MVSPPITLATDASGHTTAIVQLRELDCQGCADNIRSIISNFDGVHFVRASVPTKQVTVSYEFPFTAEVLARQLELAHFELAEPTQLEVHEQPAVAIPA